MAPKRLTLDLMALGGWKDPKTVIQSYQQADLGRMREALANRNPLTQNLGSSAPIANFYPGGNLPL